MITLIPPDEQRIEAASNKVDVVGFQFIKPGFIRHAILEGWTTAVDICIDGVPCYLLCYHLTADGGFFVDALVCYGRHGNLKLAFSAGEQLARDKKCSYIRFMTLRRGITVATMEAGFIPESVCMIKTL